MISPPLHHFQNQALQVKRLGNGEQDGVVLALGATLQDAKGAVGVQAGLRHQFQQRALAQVCLLYTSRCV